MKNYSNLPISKLLSGQAHIIEIAITGLFIGFGINLMAGSITLFEKYRPLLGFGAGLAITVLFIILAAIRIFGRRNEKYVFKGFFILNEKENAIRIIDEYDFSEKLEDYFRSAFVENKALEYIWNSEALKLQDESEKSDLRSVFIIREAVEYFVLDMLSTHLIDYFKYPGEHKEKICVLERDKIPGALLKNRFLELFSKSYEDREHFIGIDEEINDDDDYYILEVGGAIYRKFVLVLPAKSTVERVNNNEILIKTKRFEFHIKVDFDATNTTLPRGFKEKYLSIHGFEEDISNVVYNVEVEVQIKFKIGSVFSPFSWDDYNWIDTFLNKLDKSFSKEVFFENINWKAIYCAIKCIEETNIKESYATPSMAPQNKSMTSHNKAVK